MKRIFLVFLGALLLFPFSSALADVGVSVNTGLASGQNLFYGNAKNSNQGNLMLLQSRDNTNEFIFDRDGNFWASSSIRAKNICNQDASYCFSPTAGGFDVTNDSWSGTGNITMTSGSVGIGTVSPSQMLDVYGGNIRTTGTIYANANGTAYLCGGDDACLNDVNIANTVGLYGVQNGAIGSLRLGSSGATVSGNSSGDTSVNRDLYVSTHGGTGITLIGDNGYINRVRAGAGGNMMLQSDSASVIAGGWNSNEAKVIIYPGVDIYGHVNLGGQNDPSNDQGNNWLTWGYRADNNPYYAIRTNYKTYGSYTYSRLQIGWHTGIEIGAASSYGGTRFYNNSPFTGSQIMSIGDGDSNVRVVNNLLVSGNIGIGSNSPTSKLDVLGSGTSDYYAINAKNAAAHQSWKTAIYGEATASVGDTGSINNFHMGVWGYAAGTATRNYGLMGVAEGAANNVGVVGKVGDNSAFPVGNWAGWFVGAPLYVENNVAIGTQSASNKLTAVDASAYSDNAAVYGVHSVTEGYGVGLYGDGKYMGVRGNVSTNYSGSVYGGFFSVYNSGGNGYGVYASGDEYGLYAYGSQYAGYFSGPAYVSGNLGIGAMSNNARLQVSGRSLFNDGNANLDGQDLSFLANSAQMLIGWNRSSGQGEADFISNRAGGSYGGFTFYDINNSGGQTQLMRVRGDGYVGIGTEPSYRLHVYAGSAEARAIFVDANSTYGVYAYGNTAAGWFSGNTYGVWGQGSTGVRGESPSGYGVWGNSTSGLGVYGSSNTGWAGYFGGNTYVSGTLRVDTYAAGSGTYVCRNGTTFSTCSSLRSYKENIKDLDMGIETIKKLNPVSFDWKNGEKADIGLIAEDTEAVDSRLVTYENGQLEGVKYPQLSALLIKAVKQQQEQIDELKAEIEILKQKRN